MKPVWDSLRGRLILLVSLGMLPTLGLLLFAIVQARQAAYAEVESDARSARQLVAIGQENLVDGVRLVLTTLAETPEVRQANATCQPLLAAVLMRSPTYANLLVVDAAGQVVCSARPPGPDFSTAGQAWFDLPMVDGTFAAGEYAISPATGEPVIVLGYPLLDTQGRPLGVMAAEVRLERLAEVAAAATVPESAAIVNFDRNGTVLTRHPDGGNWVGQNPPDGALLLAVMGGENDARELPGLDGAVRVFAFRPLGHDADLGLTLAVGLSRDEVLAEFDTRVLRYGSVIVALTLLTLMLAYVTGIQLVLRPVDTLARGLRRLREGDLEARVHMGAVRSDLGALGQDFNAMAAAMEVRKAERREADTRLRQSEERYRALFTHGGVCAAVFDDEGRFVEANDACAEMLGYAPGALAGVSLWDVTPEADRASRQAEWQSRGQAGAYIFRRRDGGLAHVDYQAAVNVMPGHHLWMMRDVTQQLRIDLYNRVLAEAGLALQASLDQGGPLQGLLGAIVPALADWAVAHLATPAGDVALEGAAHADEAQLPRLTEAAQEHPPRADAAASAGPARVLATGKLEYHPQLDPDASAGEEPAWPPLRALGAASLIVTPLVARGRTLGALTLALTGHTRRFAPTDAALAQELGRRAALALDNARLFDEAQALNVQLEQRVAARTQQLRQSLEEVHASREALRQLSRRLQSAREAERRHIASEIHDELGGALTGLKIDAVSLRNGLTPDQTALTAKAQAMTALIDSTIQIVRRLATELRPSMLDDLGLVAALEWLAQDFGERTGLEVQFESNVEQLDLDPDSAIAVYRTAQESLTNVARHAEAARVDLRLMHDGQALHLLVADDGRGITPDEIGRLGSLGLVGMRERIASVAGELTIDSTLGKGTRISARLPLPPVANPAPSD